MTQLLASVKWFLQFYVASLYDGYRFIVAYFGSITFSINHGIIAVNQADLLYKDVYRHRFRGKKTT